MLTQLNLYWHDVVWYRAVLGLCWDYVEVVGLSWPDVGPSWGSCRPILGLCWDKFLWFGVVLGLYWGYVFFFGLSRAYVGPSRRHLGAMLAHHGARCWEWRSSTWPRPCWKVSRRSWCRGGLFCGVFRKTAATWAVDLLDGRCTNHRCIGVWWSQFILWGSWSQHQTRWP